MKDLLHLGGPHFGTQEKQFRPDAFFSMFCRNCQIDGFPMGIASQKERFLKTFFDFCKRRNFGHWIWSHDEILLQHRECIVIYNTCAHAGPQSVAIYNTFWLLKFANRFYFRSLFTTHLQFEESYRKTEDEESRLLFFALACVRFSYTNLMFWESWWKETYR